MEEDDDDDGVVLGVSLVVVVDSRAGENGDDCVFSVVF